MQEIYGLGIWFKIFQLLEWGTSEFADEMMLASTYYKKINTTLLFFCVFADCGKELDVVGVRERIFLTLIFNKHNQVRDKPR